MDGIDLEVLRHLQQDGRLNLSELGRLVHLSHSAVSERVRKLEDLGVIQGYAARLDMAKLGWPLLAFVRLRHESSDSAALLRLIENAPEIVECHHVTGEDCYISNSERDRCSTSSH
jgi:Lrp/AsnC family leucine-responsive transcriptional regulator